MHYSEHAVPNDLADVVRCVWSLEGNAPSCEAVPEPVLPDGCAELILNRGLPFEEAHAGGWREQPARFLHGQITRAIHLRPAGIASIIGVRFQPHGAYALFGPPGVITDGRVVLADLSPTADEMLSTALDGSEPGVRIAAVIDRLRTFPRHPVERAVTDLVDALLRSAGEGPIGDLKAEAPLSTRQIERRFLAVVGLRPKIFARIVRMRRLVDVLHQGDGASFASLAHAAGYYDQAHFNRDLKAFTGLAPRAYFGQDLVLPEYFTGVR